MQIDGKPETTFESRFCRARQASIGRLTLGLAHELNNPIGFVSSNLQSLANYTEDFKTLIDQVKKLSKPGNRPEEIADSLEKTNELIENLAIDELIEDLENLTHESQEGMDRLQSLVASLQEFGKKDTLKVESIELEKCLKRVLAVLRNELKYTCEIDIECDKSINIAANETRLSFALATIVMRVFALSGSRGKIEIKAYPENEYIFVSILSDKYDHQVELENRQQEDFEIARSILHEISCKMEFQNDKQVNCLLQLNKS